jgi:hypothetical protein
MLKRLREVLTLAFCGEARKARKAAREFKRLVQAYDDAIDRARAKHHPVNSLIAAKQDFVHSLLRSELGR